MIVSHALRAASGSLLLLEFGSGTATGTNATSYSFTGMSIGTANSGRYVVVCISYRQDANTSPDYPTVTVAGQSTTLIASTQNSTATTSVVRTGAAIYLTDNPVTSGTTATVAISKNAVNFSRMFASTYAITKNAPLVLVDSQASAIGTPTSPQDFTVSKSSSQVGVGMLAAFTNNTLTSFAVSGVGTENYNSGVLENGGLLSATITGSGTLTFTTTGTDSTPRCCLAIWR